MDALASSAWIGNNCQCIYCGIDARYIATLSSKTRSIFFQILQSLIGVLIVGFGAAIYLSANLGPGPRDGLMTGLTRLTNLPISLVRSTIEILVVVSGWMLGGTVGVGTVLFAFLVGPSISAGCFMLDHLVPPQKSQE